MKKLTTLLLLTITLNSFGQTKPAKNRYFLINVSYSDNSTYGSAYYTNCSKLFPSKKEIEEFVFKNYGIYDHIIIENITEFKNKEDWYRFNYGDK